MIVRTALGIGMAVCFGFFASARVRAAESLDVVIKIGVPEPLSGSFAAEGTDAVNGAKLAALEINATGGVFGRKLEVLGIDDACEAQQGVQAMFKLIDQGSVAIAGVFCYGATVPESDVASRVGAIPFMATVSSNPHVTEQVDATVSSISTPDHKGARA